MRRPKASTFKKLPKNNQKYMDSSEILASMWKKLDVDEEDDSVSDDSQSFEKIEV